MAKLVSSSIFISKILEEDKETSHNKNNSSIIKNDRL